MAECKHDPSDRALHRTPKTPMLPNQVPSRAMVLTRQLQFDTQGENDIVDLTESVAQLVKESGIASGTAGLFVMGSTAALTTIEFEPGLVMDFPAALEKIAPKGARYAHEERWHDDNGHSHVRASLIGPDLSVPFYEGKLMLGQWQQIVLVECDTRARNRLVMVQLVG